MPIKFDKWFQDQFGPRQEHGAPSDQELADRVRDGYNAKAELERRQRWDSQNQAALYAYTLMEIDEVPHA